MPKLVYFPLMGRAQAIRFLLTHKGVEFEDVKLTFEEWGPAKAAGTYTPVGGSLPSYIDDAGVKYNQGRAILDMLAIQHGVYPTTAAELYEFNWYFETLKDHEKPELMPVIFAEGQPEELQQKFCD
jgi:glutathione S-transferase